MLAYTLQIDRSQLEPPFPPDKTLVVVDDCAISGANFGRFLESVKNKCVVFVHLYSHPDLRSAIQGREEKVVACISAADLEDIAPELYGSDYATWKSRWQSRMDSAGYWIGQPEYIAFAWNEPDIAFWNPAAEKLEKGWNLLSPSLCLKNRSASARIRDRIHIQPEGCGPIRPAASVVYAKYHEGIVVGDAQTEECYFLQDTEADIWLEIVALGTIEGVVSTLSLEYAVDAETLREDISNFVEQLVKASLLEKNDEIEITPGTT
jgi:hypothetical protein